MSTGIGTTEFLLFPVRSELFHSWDSGHRWLTWHMHPLYAIYTKVMHFCVIKFSGSSQKMWNYVSPNSCNVDIGISDASRFITLWHFKTNTFSEKNNFCFFLLRCQWLTEYKTSSKIRLRQGNIVMIFIEMKSSNLGYQRSCPGIYEVTIFYGEIKFVLVL